MIRFTLLLFVALLTGPGRLAAQETVDTQGITSVICGVSTALVMIAIALMLLALMLLTPNVRANPVRSVSCAASRPRSPRFLGLHRAPSKVSRLVWV
jgi:hypothetical protein